MKLIAHRANTNGPNSNTENNPDKIIECIENGYNVEVDIRYDIKTDTLWLGHDTPEYMVNWWWLAGKADHLWIHCKDIQTLHEFSTKTSSYNYFWHQNDDYTLTSKNYIWSYPGKSYTSNTVIVMPETVNIDLKMLSVYNCYGVCTDFVDKLV